MTSRTPYHMAPPMILALSPVLALLVSPGYMQYMGHGGEPTFLHDLTASTEQQCEAACWANGVCNRYLFEIWNNKCYLFWCPDVAACETNSLEDLLSFQRMKGRGQATSAHVAKPAISSSRLREGETAIATTKTTVGGLMSATVLDTTTLLTVLLFGQLFLITIALIFVRKVCESFRKRPYSRLDYLENGIYSDSTL
ncbi:hypothetical protein GJAV_G00231430 [Gymnothorax javanicus]|nr:hypothetical protein GJAV_G00231430 [Gymnothorax javanicus]